MDVQIRGGAVYIESERHVSVNKVVVNLPAGYQNGIRKICQNGSYKTGRSEISSEEESLYPLFIDVKVRKYTGWLNQQEADTDKPFGSAEEMRAGRLFR